MRISDWSSDVCSSDLRKDIFPQTSRKFFREYQPLSLPNNGLALAQGNNLYDPAVLAATFAAYGVTPPPGLGEAFIIGFNPDKSLFLTSRGGVNYQSVPGVDRDRKSTRLNSSH